MAKVSRHKRFDLAERHARQIERETGSKVVIHRRNAKGRFDSRGTYYTFYIPGQKEYIVNVIHSKQSKGSPHVEVQISATGPAGASRDEVLQAVSNRIENDEDDEGWKTKILFWDRANKKYTAEESEFTEEEWQTSSFVHLRFLLPASKSKVV